jgi:hypothetical protein
VPLPAGAVCKRTSCKYRLDDAAPAGREQQPACLYHPGAPIFREGSKGYTCCKRRVLDFDDFLKMDGCRTAESGHLFVGQKKEVRMRRPFLVSLPYTDYASRPVCDLQSSAKEVVAARIDHYQTPALIHMSVFAKKVDAASSSITFTRDSVSPTIIGITVRVRLVALTYPPSFSHCRSSSTSTCRRPRSSGPSTSMRRSTRPRRRSRSSAPRSTSRSSRSTARAGRSSSGWRMALSCPRATRLRSPRSVTRWMRASQNAQTCAHGSTGAAGQAFDRARQRTGKGQKIVAAQPKDNGDSDRGDEARRAWAWSSLPSLAA